MGQCQSVDGIGPDEDFGGRSLVCRSQARTFPPVPGKEKVLDFVSTAGECGFLLEQVLSVPGIDDVTRACASSRQPYVRAWAERGGKLLGEVAEWPARASGHPAWFSARSLGFPMAAASSATLQIELREGNNLLCSAQTDMKDLKVHQRIDLATDAQPGVPKASVSFQILDCQAVLRPRTVFLVRHGESEWNKAQSSLDLRGMVRTTDHPLSGKGRDQAEGLRQKLQIELDKARAGKASQSMAPMLQPGLILASPLGRALQTAVIAYGPLDKAEVRQMEMVLAPNCKEKQNFGGLDTVCTKMGQEILDSSQEELKSLYSGLDKDKFIVDSFQQLSYDLEEVQEKWWPEGQAESTTQLKARLQEFMYQLLFASQESVVVFGHSLFFQQLMREFISDDVRRSDLGQRLSKLKLPNCGVVRLDLDPRKMLKGPFVKAELLLGTEMVGGDSFSLNCCASTADLKDELRLDDTMSLKTNASLHTIPEESPEEVDQPSSRVASPAAEKAVVASEAQEETEKVIEVKVPSEAPPAKPVEPAKPARSAKKCCPF